MINFVAIDFETANAYRTSACSIGLTVFEGGKAVESVHRLIKPTPAFFAAMNCRIHGIYPDDVAEEPTFEELWHFLQPYLEDKALVAHNASFDHSVLRHTLQHYEIAPPAYDYFCSLRLARKAFPHLPKHGLGSLAGHFGIELNHHNAESDARACGEIILRILAEHQLTSLDDMLEQFGFQWGRSSSVGMQSFGKKKNKKKYTLRNT
mgnify:CR=1 FL=1